MAQIPAFTSAVPLLSTDSGLAQSSLCPAVSSSPLRPSRPALRPHRAASRPAAARRSKGARATTTVAVLDLPASDNTYLQRHAEMVLRDFLVRRAVNTVQFYMYEFHDMPSHTWLANFNDFARRVQAHTFKDGDRHLSAMWAAPTEEATIRVGNHPRLMRRYTYKIEPRAIAKRVTDCRLQLALEWAKDLRCVRAQNAEIRRMACERALTSDEAELAARQALVFDSDPLATDQTPLRFRNYAALKTLCTQHAVARLLPYLRDRGSNHEYMYLLQFVNSFGAIADGDQMLTELMARPHERRTNPEHIIVPRSIADQVLELRAAIADEWISVMEYIPEEHRLSTLRNLENSMNLSHDVPDSGAGRM